MFVIVVVVASGAGDGSLVSATTFEAGHASTSGIGSGEIHDLPDGGQVINAI
ncbi:MAG: hypothetical protein ACREJN_19745 [Nitrospiraceae bacterium]